MKEITHQETITAVRALANVLEQTNGKLTSKERSSLVRSVLKTVAPSSRPAASKPASKAGRGRRQP